MEKCSEDLFEFEENDILDAIVKYEEMDIDEEEWFAGKEQADRTS